jgi:molybdopterin synthase catalytic subunit
LGTLGWEIPVRLLGTLGWEIPVRLLGTLGSEIPVRLLGTQGLGGCAKIGEMERHLRVALREEELDPPALLAEVSRPDAGATALFLGTARDHSPGKTDVTHLLYDAYREHVEAKLLEIVTEAAERWPVLAAICEHRIGRVDVGHPSVAVAVATAHRGDAFEAARYVIDELKDRAPIWKQEHWSGGAEWVEGA